MKNRWLPSLILRTRKFIKEKDKVRYIIFCILVLTLASSLRLYHYDSIPDDKWTADEIAFCWNGMSLIQNHVPTAWSWLSSYGDFPIVMWQGHSYKLVTPWFDHPPLFSLVVGGAAILGGANSFFDVSMSVIRIPSLIFGILSVFLLFHLCTRLFNIYIALISSLVYATNPSIVFLSRLAVSENLIICLTLSMLICFLEYRKTSRGFYLYISILLAGLASISKVTGLFLIITLCLLLVYLKKWRVSIIACLSGLLMFSLYFIYGYYYDIQLFLSVIFEQSGRFNSLSIVKNLLFQNYEYKLKFIDIDIWFAFSWFIFMLVLYKLKYTFQSLIIFLPIITYLFVLFLSGGQSHYFLWYNIMFYPFLSIILGYYLYFFIKNSDFFTAFILLIFFGAWFINIFLLDSDWKIVTIKNITYFKYIFFSWVCIVLGVYLWHSIRPSENTRILKFISSTFIIGMMLMSNIYIIYIYTTQLAIK